MLINIAVGAAYIYTVLYIYSVSVSGGTLHTVEQQV
jgi:hypothetical protein